MHWDESKRTSETKSGDEVEVLSNEQHVSSPAACSMTIFSLLGHSSIARDLHSYPLPAKN